MTEESLPRATWESLRSVLAYYWEQPIVQIVVLVVFATAVALAVSS